MSIINKPELKSSRQKTIESFIVAVGIITLNVILISFTLALWGFSVKYISNYLFSADAIENTLKMLLNLIFFGVLIFLSMLAWAKYNILMYANRNRRKHLPPLAPEMIAAYYNTDIECVRAAGKCKSGTVDVENDELIFCDNEMCFPIKEIGSNK